MNILYVEPYYSGSHKQWIDSYKKKSRHEISILSLKGIHWKWRMHGGAITLSKKFLADKRQYDLIMVSYMLNLPLFKSLCYQKINKTKIVIYFHENQISYPRSSNDKDIKFKRDFHSTFINYTSSLTSDYNLFNSQYHFDDYFNGLEKYLKKMPDNNNLNSIKIIKNKSSVLHIGCNIKKFNIQSNNKNDIPIILWNHRWEHDKDPETFFKILFKVAKKRYKFNLIILGQSYNKYPKCFDLAVKKLKSHIIHSGYCKNKDDYEKWLIKADVLPVTSIQDFFGLSIVEAVSANIYPLLPNRLSYPEILDKKNNPELFYDNETMLYDKLCNYLNDYKKLRYSTSKYKSLVNRFDWSNMVGIYDQQFEKYYKI